ncbi:TPA: hypothetical protein I4D94_22255 [Enterobacter asburiae]|nr:hypothetical protein [Enterobacter asburiae]
MNFMRGEKILVLSCLIVKDCRVLQRLSQIIKRTRPPTSHLAFGTIKLHAYERVLMILFLIENRLRNVLGFAWRHTNTTLQVFMVKPERIRSIHFEEIQMEQMER